MKVAIVDDHQLFRKSLAHLLNSFDDIDVVFQANNGKEFLDSIDAYEINLVLLDIQMPEMDGFQTCKVLRDKYPSIYVLIISQLTTKESIHRVMELGAHGFFTKNSDPDQLQNAIVSIKENGYYFGNELGPIIREVMLWEKKNMANSNDTLIDVDENCLTSREIEIIKLVSNGRSSKEISEILSINVRTVETHRKHIMEKTNSKNFIGVVVFALKYQLIALEEI
ncbi:response regulator transcription factor [Flavobacterium jejuense]|uniref:Response regulator transcription factor n=1 Tax=Flavobacterium jejuense TaxID=1544455 RepID=A0ABX0J1D3_9FLAO|nr:response regulator transcription factor [Flavobacterium jejuense]NHN28001.1 response regulator transcription factor [Flavobacterium jejuense]